MKGKKNRFFSFKRPFVAAKGNIKSILSRANPARKSIDKNDVTDTGTESVKLGIKTTEKTIKTTKRTIKTSRTVGSIAKRTARATGSAVKVVTMQTASVIRLSTSAITAVIAAVTNPIILILLATVIVFLLMASFVVMVFGGGAVASSTGNKVYNAAGLIEPSVVEQYNNGINFCNTAIANKRNGFNSLIDSIYYDYNNLRGSDLSYFKKTSADGTEITFVKSFTPDSRKTGIKGTWEFTIEPSELVAIAYVYLEKNANTSNGTQNAIYKVTYTQEVFNTIIDKCVSYADTIYPHQGCPNLNCTRHIEVVPNPDYAAAVDANNRAVEAYNDWCDVIDKMLYCDSITNTIYREQYWKNVVVPGINGWIVKFNRYPDTANFGLNFLDILGREYESANAVLNNTPPTIEKVTYICEYQHNLHSIGLVFSSKDAVMNALGFTEADKQWVEFTEIGFEKNPNIM